MMPLVIARVAGAGITGGLAVYVARTEGAEFSGRFFVFVSTITIVSVLTRLGADPYLSAQIAPRAADGHRATTRFLVATIAAVGLLVALSYVILQVLELLLGDWMDDVLGGVPVYLLIPAVAGLNMVWIVGAYCRATGKAAQSIFVETGLFSLWLFGILEIARRTSLDPTPRTVAIAVFLLLPLLLAVLGSVLFQARHHWATMDDIKQALIGIVVFGAVTVTNGIIILIPLQVLGWNGLHEEAGVYNAALRVSMFVGAFGVVIKSIVVREAVRRTGEERSRMADVKQAGLIAVPWVLLSLAIAWQGRLLASMFGPDFSELKSVILIMLVAQCVYVSGNLIETRAVLAGEKYLLNLTSGTTLVVALVVTPPLVAWYGLNGAVWGFALTITASRAQLVWLYLRPPRRFATAASQQPEAVVGRSVE